MTHTSLTGTASQIPSLPKAQGSRKTAESWKTNSRIAERIPERGPLFSAANRQEPNTPMPEKKITDEVNPQRTRAQGEKGGVIGGKQGGKALRR